MENDELSFNLNKGPNGKGNGGKVGEKHVEENVLPNWNFPTSLLCFGR